MIFSNAFECELGASAHAGGGELKGVIELSETM